MTAAPLIVLVDDDSPVRDSTSLLLQRAGLRVLAFSNGEDFLATSLPADAACLLLDIHMPGFDGVAVMRALRARNSKLPIIVVTGSCDDVIAAEVRELGANAILEKPCPSAELLAAIDRVLAETRDFA